MFRQFSFALFTVFLVGCAGKHQVGQEPVFLPQQPYFVSQVPTEPIVRGSTWSYCPIAATARPNETLWWGFTPTLPKQPGLSWDSSLHTLYFETNENTPIGKLDLGYISVQTTTAYGTVIQQVNIRVVERSRDQ